MTGKRLLLLLAAVLLVLYASLVPAWAYFTTQTKAKGGYTLVNPSVTTVTEKFHDWVKEVTIVNREGSGPVFIRVRAYAGSGYTLLYQGDENWTDGGDGWWYYRPILEAQSRNSKGELVGGTASGLSVRIEGVPAEPRAGENFNVVLVYESTPVQYDENGQPFADWTMTLDSGEVNGGQGG